MSETPSGEPGRWPVGPDRQPLEGTWGGPSPHVGEPTPYGGLPAHSGEPPSSGGPPAYSGPPDAYPGGHPFPYGPPQPRTNPYAIASLVCSLAGFVTGISAIAGIVLGHIALSQIKQTGEEGRTLAIAGLAVGYGLLVVGVLLVIAIIFFVAVAGGWMATMDGTTTY